MPAAERKWDINHETGRWSWKGPELALENAVTSVELDGVWVALEQGKVSFTVPVRDALGEGEKTVIRNTAGGVELTLTLTQYTEGTRALVEATMRNVSARPQSVTRFRAFQATAKTRGPASACRFLKNSGSQGTSGAVAIGSQTPLSAYVTAVVDPAGKGGLALGAISYHRADTTITARAAGEHEVELTAEAIFSRIPIQPGETLSSEAYLLEWSDDPLTALEHYAEAVATTLQIKLPRHPEGLWNIWYGYREEENTEENVLKCADFQAAHLVQWGIPWLSTGCWQKDNAFMEDRVKPDKYPRGLKATCDEIRRRGLKPFTGGFFARVTETAPVFQEHPEFIVAGGDGKPYMAAPRSWGRCPHPMYLFDITNPAAQEWYRDYWKRIVETGCREWFCIDFEGTSSKGIRKDMSRNAPFELDRRRLEIIHEVIGRDAHLGSYTSPTNRYAGLADHVRIGPDVGNFGAAAPWGHLRKVSRNASAAWFYHQRMWITDPDPPMVGTQADPTRLEEVRIRLLIVALSGGFITLGDRMPEMEPGQFRLLSTVLPPTGPSARPVDLFRREVPEIHDLRVETDWDAWHVVSMINWDDPLGGDARVEAQADSEAVAGNKVPYSPRWAFDGKLGTSLASPTACWISEANRPEPHWISATYSAPRTVSEIALHWAGLAKPGGETEWWTSRHFLIQAWAENDWKTIAEIRNDASAAGVAVTTHAVAPITTTRLRILQPKGGGAPTHENRMALGEVELRGPEPKGKEMRVDFSELGLKKGEEYFAYDFWKQEPLGAVRDGLTLVVLPQTSRLLSIRTMPKTPWVVGTDLHVSQGGVELREVKWDAAAGTLSGVAERPGESGHLVIHVPKEFAAGGAKVEGRTVELVAGGKEIVRLPVAFEGKAVRWSVGFTQR